MWIRYFIVFCFLITGCAKPNYQDLPITKEIGAHSDNQQFKTTKLYFPNQKIDVDLTWSELPAEGKANEFTLKFYLSENADLPIALSQSVAVSLWMPSMGHGSSPVKIEKIADGLYKVTRIYFIMPGDWEIHLQLKENTNVIEQVIQNIRI
ncbi:MAG: FixH family protein [Pseudobdellovibrio sp.]